LAEMITHPSSLPALVQAREIDAVRQRAWPFVLAHHCGLREASVAPLGALPPCFQGRSDMMMSVRNWPRRRARPSPVGRTLRRSLGRVDAGGLYPPILPFREAAHQAGVVEEPGFDVHAGRTTRVPRPTVHSNRVRS